jgi:2-haloacid dehalogenase
MNKKNSTESKAQFSFTRRQFVATSVASIAAATLSGSPMAFPSGQTKKIKAIAFDAFPIFDPRPIFTLVENMYPEKGVELGDVWRAKQFEYSWLRTAAGQYNDFWKVTKDALIFAARKTGITLTADHEKQLMDQYLSLNVWPDVLSALQILKQNGIRLSFLSNMTNEMLASCIKHSKIETYFDAVISTDNAKTYKPDPAAYRLGIDTLKLRKEEILFVAFAGWDASGAKWFGYPTFWINRLGTSVEELNAIPDGMGETMTDLVDFLKLE